MAIAEKLGKDRRGNPVFSKDQDGAELLFDVEKQYLVTIQSTLIFLVK